MSRDSLYVVFVHRWFSLQKIRRNLPAWCRWICLHYRWYIYKTAGLIDNALLILFIVTAFIVNQNVQNITGLC